MKPVHFTLIGLAVVAATIIVVGLVFAASPYQFQGTLFEPPVPAKPLALTDQRGNMFSMADFGGETGQKKMALVFFGYTHCPDVCPLTLVEFKQVKAELGKDSDQVSFVFITVDPERDTPEHLELYLNNFDLDFVGLTGSLDAMEPVWSHFGVYRAKQDSDSAAGYLMDHSARTYLVNADGDMLLSYAYDTEVEKLAADIRHLLKEAK